MDDFDAIAQAELAALLANSDPNNPVTPTQLAEAIKRYAQEQLAQLPPSEESVEQQGIHANRAYVDEALERGIDLIVEMVDGNPHQRVKFSEENIQKYFGGEDPWLAPRPRDDCSRPPPGHNGFDIIRAISGYPFITAHLGLFLHPRDLIKLYSISRDFHSAIDSHLLSSIVVWLRRKAPNAVSDFPFKLYGDSTTRDPAGRTFAYEMQAPIASHPLTNTTRIVPTLRWYHMVIGRERYVQQIIAFMARAGHRLPRTMATTLKRIWLIMDVASNSGRVGFMKNQRFWTNTDLYNAQMFCVKLDMLFNDPLHGPSSSCMTKLMLGQRGLFPLWQLLFRRKFTTIPEIIELKVRYDYVIHPEHVQLVKMKITVLEVPFEEVGRGHREGWGVGAAHLFRPDELVMAESTRRQLHLEDHLVNMSLWGMADWRTGASLIPTEEEMYLSDEDELLERVDTTVMYKMRHPKKARWDTLTEEEKEEIRMEERLEEMQAVKVSRCIGCPKQDGTVEAHQKGSLPVVRMTDRENYDLNWEARRGWASMRMTKEEMEEALEELPLYERQPADEEQRRLEVEVRDGLMRAKDMVTEDEKLKAQAWYNYDEDDLDFDYEGYAAALDNGLVDEMDHGGVDEEDVDEGEADGAVGSLPSAHIADLLHAFGIGGQEGGAEQMDVDEE
ncbi:uncharacterized protein DNG_01120 [Cephalotrichum gorgonifer]|uniref:Uncharacterized protein n=1 Tax=Cephalotrichum gorgonifer TaxID=2041049 RepID=A0AAE8MS20_9PEZI|nr:uncharacterized protein DNG_01120 [Cephalotrichum gorgonifer]